MQVTKTGCVRMFSACAHGTVFVQQCYLDGLRCWRVHLNSEVTGYARKQGRRWGTLPPDAPE